MEVQPTFYDVLAQWSEIIGGFAFVVVAVLLFARYVLPAVRSAQASSNAELILAEQRREALKADVVKARAELEAADREAAVMKARAVAEAQHERDRILTEARADGERLVANAGGELHRARIAAQAQLRTEYIEQALILARQMADARIDHAANSRLVAGTVAALLRSKPQEHA